MLHKILAAFLGLLLIAFATLGIGAAVFHFMRPPYNEGFEHYPLIVKSHVVLGALYLFFGVFQFVPAIRNNWISYHRAAGRLLVAIALIIGVTALFMGLIIPFSGLPEQVVMGFFGTFFLISIITGFTHVRAGRIAMHREWMIRAYALGAAIVTMRLIFIPLLIINKVTSNEITALYSIGSFTVAFVIHALIAELWIRSTRSGSPRASNCEAVAPSR